MKTILGVDVGAIGALEKIKWKPVVGYEGYYEVNNLGEVRSIERKIKNRFSFRVLKPRILKGKTDKDGYRLVELSMNSKVKTFKVHRIVLESFKGPCLKGYECRHLDGIKTNNNLLNLVWGSKKENASDKKTHGTEIYGERNGNYKSQRNRDGRGRWY